MELNNDGLLVCKFKQKISINLHIVDIYLTGDLAFQAMALGKESMATWGCMQCKASKSQFMDENSGIWTMDELVWCGIIAKSTNDEPKLGIKQRPWWPLIPLTNYVSPLLHCEIGVGNFIFKLLRDIINEHIEIYPPGEESIRMAVPALKQIIAVTAKQRDVWDESESDKGDTWKTLKRAVATHQKRRRLIIDSIENKRLIVDSIEDEREVTYTSNMIKLSTLQNFRDGMGNKLKKARRTLADHQAKLKEMWRAKVRGQQSILETKVFKVLKEIGFELSSYH
jgi:hypothetical protein